MKTGLESYYLRNKKNEYHLWSLVVDFAPLTNRPCNIIISKKF